MPGYNVTSGAAAFSGTLEDAMLQREQAKRQAMLDQLALRKDAREATEHQQNSSLRAQELKERIAEHQDNNRFKDMAETKVLIQDLPPGEIPPPELMAKAKQHGIPLPVTPLLAAPPVPGMTPPDMAGPQPGSYMGTPLQQRRGKFIEGMEAGPQKTAYQAEDLGLKAVAPLKEAKEPNLVKVVSQNAKGQNVEQWVTPQEAKDMGEMKSPSQPKPPTVTVNAGGAPSTSIPGWSKEAIDMEAVNRAKGAPLPAFGMMGKGEKTLALGVIENRAAQYDKEQGKFIDDPTYNKEKGFTAPDLALNKTTLHADAGALSQLEKNASAVAAFSNTAKKNGALLDAVLSHIPDAGVTWLNKPARAFATALGSEDMAEFKVLRQSVQTEYARTINNPALTGVLSDTARKEIEEGLADNATVGQLKRSIHTLAKEAKNREDSIQEEIKVVTKRIKGGPDDTPTKKTSLSAAELIKKYSSKD